MKHTLAVRDLETPAPCRGAKRLLTIAIITCLLAVLGTAADLALRARTQDDASAAWMKAMNLTAPALWPAGTPMRHPETAHPGVDLRFSVGLEHTG